MPHADRPVWPPVVVVGAGAIGAFLAARFSTLTDVLVITRPQWVHQLADQGLELRGYMPGHFMPRVGTWSPELELPESGYVFVTVKAYHLKEVLGLLKGYLNPDHRIVLCQNGLGIEELAREVLPDHTLVRAACWLGVTREGPTRARVTGVGHIDLATREPERAELGPLKRLIEAASIPAKLGGSVPETEWRKTLSNIGINLIGALMEAPNGVILEHPELKKVSRMVLEEARQVAAAEGVTLTEADLQAVEELIATTRHNINSTLQDIRRGNRTEARYLNGAVIRLGQAHGIPTPVNETIYLLLRAAEKIRITGGE
jgi:2-dehydropantoate 2-reductase